MPEALDVAELLGIDPDVARSTADTGFGVTTAGFVPKPFSRLLAEKLLLARALFGDDVDLGAGSALRKLLELASLEDARTWSALGSAYDDAFVATAAGDALGRLGAELGLPRPYLEARGQVKLRLVGSLPDGVTTLRIARGARMLSPGGHDASTDDAVVLSAASPEADVAVTVFHPGEDLDPADPDECLTEFNRADPALAELSALQADGATVDVEIDHTTPLTGGTRQWPDARYRELLLRAPRSLWTADAVRLAAALVPGVRQVQVRDAWGGLDIHQSIFGTAQQDFVERLFSEDDEAASPYRVLVVVAPTPAAIWDGPGGLRETVTAAIDDVRPLGILPRVVEADQVGVGLTADVWVRGVPLGSGTANAGRALRARLLERVRRYVDGLGFGEPVRYAEVIAVLMEEPGVIDVRALKLLRYPPGFDGGQVEADPVELPPGQNVELQVNQVPVFAGSPDDNARLRVQSR